MSGAKRIYETQVRDLQKLEEAIDAFEAEAGLRAKLAEDIKSIADAVEINCLENERQFELQKGLRRLAKIIGEMVELVKIAA